MTIDSLSGAQAETEQPVSERLVYRDDVARKRDRQALLEEQQTVAQRVRRAREAA